jgi:uncharacterized protein YecT (DUF1311 family)
MRTFLAILFFLSVAQIINAASFDCSKASTNIEKAVCSNNFLGTLDSEMALVYKQLKSTLPPDQWQNVKAAQISWLKNRESICPDAETDCLSRLFRQRIDALTAAKNQSVENALPQSSKMGSLKDIYSGYYSISFTNDDLGRQSSGIFLCKQISLSKYVFYLSIHRGECSGYLNDTLVFSDSCHARLNKVAPDDTCQILFDFSMSGVKITEDNCQTYHGMRCYFSEKYTKSNSIHFKGPAGLRDYSDYVEKADKSEQIKFIEQFSRIMKGISKTEGSNVSKQPSTALLIYIGDNPYYRQFACIYGSNLYYLNSLEPGVALDPNSKKEMDFCIVSDNIKKQIPISSISRLKQTEFNENGYLNNMVFVTATINGKQYSAKLQIDGEYCSMMFIANIVQKDVLGDKLPVISEFGRTDEWHP